jgi:hypothetical protein
MQHDRGWLARDPQLDGVLADFPPSQFFSSNSACESNFAVGCYDSACEVT